MCVASAEAFVLGLLPVEVEPPIAGSGLAWGCRSRRRSTRRAQGGRGHVPVVVPW